MEWKNYVRPKVDRVSLNIWENPNRKIFSSWMDDSFKITE